MPGYRTVCPYCKSSILSRDIGKHVVKSHGPQVFTGDSLKNLHKDKFLTRPLEIFFDTDPYFFCFADLTCIRKEETARQHFKKVSAEDHKAEIVRLREEFPLGDSTSSEAPSLLTKKQQRSLEADLKELLSKLRDYETTASVSEEDRFSFAPQTLQALACLNLDVEPQPPASETPPSEPVQEELSPLVEEPPLTKEELFQQAFSDPKFVKEISTSVLTGQQVKVPELEALKKAPSSEPPASPLKQRGLKTVQSEAPPPPPPPPPPAPVEEVISEMDAFQKMTPWERFLKTNPTLSVQEQLQVAQSLGIRPDSSSPFKIVQNSKLKRPIKA